MCKCGDGLQIIPERWCKSGVMGRMARNNGLRGITSEPMAARQLQLFKKMLCSTEFKEGRKTDLHESAFSRHDTG